MSKRIFDISIAMIGLLIFSPLMAFVSIVIFFQDFHSPFYIGQRIGRGGKTFRMIKFRSMIIYADKSGVDSTSSRDSRITGVGQWIRRYKIDELPQLFNVLKGDMSFVGPRPNVKRDVDLYTPIERKLLATRPGITDFSSIVFSDEGEILKDSQDPDLDYNQLIRPWKSRLGIFYVENRSLLIDISLIIITVVAIISKRRATLLVSNILRKHQAESDLVDISLRNAPLCPQPPPGSTEIVSSRLSL